MAPVSKTTDTTPSSGEHAPNNNDSASSSSGGRKPLTSPFVTPKPRWFNNILGGKAVDALQEDDLLPAVDDDSVEAEVAVEMNEEMSLDDRHLPLAFCSIRHEEDIKGIDIDESAQTWRMRERMKTVSVALVVCLNIGVDPPDVKKTEPCARMECWIHPLTLNSQRALETIGSNLQKQYERWQPRARYRQSLDPTVEEVRRLATGLRRSARDERVLFHYNGHGVPKPTANGEIWVFNRAYTQYIPLSLYDLQSWMGSPSIFVYDCSNAGIIVSCFEQFAEQHEREYHEQVATQGVSVEISPPISNRNCIQLAACSAIQLLPMNPELPADLFTSCLTTPIKMALRWFVMQNQGKLAPRITVEMLDKIPGQFGDRRTMLGELNWIFTAITDTIAWNNLPRVLFQKLFRQDLLVASLFRNFLLAERVMRSYDCTPVSAPRLPETHQHAMWKAWDLAVDMALAQLPMILEKGVAYKASTFFEEQLTAFEVWLRYGDQHRPPPEQLPIVLQVLLSQAHRLRALDLLGRFLDLGPWAVNLALSVGIFPYVLKLLQAHARELRPLLVSIWAKILSVDTSCQTDLIRDNSHRYFLSVLVDDCMMPNHHTWAAFILASIVHNFRQGQQEAEQGNLIAICLEHLNDPEPVLRQWLAIALGRVWDSYEPARWRGARDNAPEKLYELLKDEVPEVRAAAVFALGTFVNSCEERTEHANSLDHMIALHLLKTAVEDGSSLVRTELVVALQHVVFAFEANFINACRSYMGAEGSMSKSASGPEYAATLSPTTSLTGNMKSPSPSGLKRTPSSMNTSTSSPALDRMSQAANRSSGSLSSMNKLASALAGVGSVYDKVYRALEFLSVDPHHIVSGMAQALVVYLRQRVKSKDALSRPSLSIPAPPFQEAFSASSAPSSPAKDLKTTPPQDGVSPKPSVSTIKEETVDLLIDSNALMAAGGSREKPPPNSATHPRLSRGGSVGRHPSGQHNNQQLPQPTLAPVRQTHSANVSLLANSALPRPDLTTDFIPWSAKYFTKQLMRHECVECDCDHESVRHWSREWMFNRNAKVRSRADHEHKMLQNKLAKIDASLQPNVANATSVMRCAPQTASAVVFHPFDSIMVAAGNNIINIWTTVLGSAGKLNQIELNSKKTISISSLEMVNAHDDPALLVGYDNGGVIVLRNFANKASMRLVAAWNGLRELESQRRLQQLSSAASVIASTAVAKTSWCQVQSTLALAADSRYIRVWDAKKEMRKNDLLTEDASGAVTSLHFAPTTSATGLAEFLVSGFTSGSVKLFDTREWGRAPVMKLDDLLGSPILDAKIQDCSGQSLLVAGNAKGFVRMYDIRMPVQAINLGSDSGLGLNASRMAVHPRCGVLASWFQQQQSVGLYTLDSISGSCQLLNYVKYHDEGVLGQRLGQESGSLRFHPYLLQLAVASREGAISVKGLRQTI